MHLFTQNEQFNLVRFVRTRLLYIPCTISNELFLFVCLNSSHYINSFVHSILLDKFYFIKVTKGLLVARSPQY